jgi:hypothetical protein
MYNTHDTSIIQLGIIRLSSRPSTREKRRESRYVRAERVFARIEGGYGRMCFGRVN